MTPSRDAANAREAYLQSLARVFENLALGIGVFGIFLLLHPDATPRQLAATATAGLTTLLLSALCARRWFPVTLASPLGRRPVAILLLGSSLAALLWSDSPIPLLLTLAVITGFIARWSLFALEVRDIRISDELRIGLPTLATRTRLIITWLTGALIPALVLLGIWTKPLLISAFLLTFFNQWTATCEGILARNHEKNRLQTRPPPDG